MEGWEKKEEGDWQGRAAVTVDAVEGGRQGACSCSLASQGRTLPHARRENEQPARADRDVIAL